jgi:hypothetical protein
MAVPVLLGLGVMSFFRLSGEAAALRATALEALPGKWDNKVTLHPGFFTTALVRAGAPFFKLPPEAQAAIASLRGVEVAVYKNSQATADWVDTGAVLARADETMSARRWDRVVGVSRDDELVAVYTPRRGVTVNSIRCCVLVLHRNDLVVAGASGKIDPLIDIAQRHHEIPWHSRSSPGMEFEPAGGLVPVGYLGH